MSVHGSLSGPPVTPDTVWRFRLLPLSTSCYHARMQASNPLRKRARQIVRKLARLYPHARCALDYSNPLQLLIATILSAQCTDKRVNLVTPALFARYPDAAAFAKADRNELQDMIRSTGFYRGKARSIQEACQALVEKHGGQVPNAMAELVQLQGVARKTANVVLGNAFDIPGITVDTHVGRLSRRLGLTTFTDPVKVERDLMNLIPEKDWTSFSHGLIFHGRQVCHSRNPRCAACALAALCPKIGVENARPSSKARSVARSKPRPVQRKPIHEKPS